MALSDSIRGTINDQQRIRVTINDQQRKRISVGTADPRSLSSLNDVITANVANNYVLVFDSSLNKYVMQELSEIDGGSF